MINFESFENKPRKWRCNRCKSDNVLDYGDSFDCKNCGLEFEKADSKLYEDPSLILSVEEKLGILRELLKSSLIYALF